MYQRSLEKIELRIGDDLHFSPFANKRRLKEQFLLNALIRASTESVTTTTFVWQQRLGCE